MEAYKYGLRNLSREHGFEPLAIEGAIPHDLRGTLYLNGPGLSSLYGRSYRHWFDGDGAVTAVNFDERVTGAVRLVQGYHFKQEQKAGRPLYTSGSTLAPQWWRRLGLRFKNVANTKALFWNERLFALYEAGLPTEVDPNSLDTIGETALDGTVKGYFSAHFHEVPHRKAFYNFSIKRGRTHILHLYELPYGQQARLIATVPIPRCSSMLHDFIATEKNLIFFIPPVGIRPLPVLLGTKAPSETLEWQPHEGTTVLIIPIDHPESFQSFKVAPFFQYHFMNAYEQGNEIVVDFVRTMDFEASFKNHDRSKQSSRFATEGRLYRAVIRPDEKTLQLEQRWDEPCEFPQVAPARQGCRHRFGYVLASNDGQPQSKIAKIDYETAIVQTVAFMPNQFPSEAVFVPRKMADGEDDGYLLSLTYDRKEDRSFVAIYDARSMSQEPIGRVWFDHHIPRPLHGTWRQAEL